MSDRAILAIAVTAMIAVVLIFTHRLEVVGVQYGNAGGVFLVDRLTGSVRFCWHTSCKDVHDQAN